MGIYFKKMYQTARTLWKRYQHIYTKLLPNRRYIYEQNVLGINLQSKKIDIKIKKILLTITEIIINELWLTRRKKWPAEPPVEPNIRASIIRINGNITRLIRTHYKYHKSQGSIDKFKDRFLREQALGHLNERNELVLHLPEPEMT